MQTELELARKYDYLLGISTDRKEWIGNKYQEYHRYEPTPYYALLEFSQRGYLIEQGVMVDFGCGAMRVGCYFNYFHHLSYVGLEMKLKYFKEGLNAKEGYVKKVPRAKKEIEILCYLAEQYRIEERENIFYFFYPFSITIFRKVMDRILESYENKPRLMEIILYYPDTTYLDYLRNETPFEQIQEIQLEPYVKKDEREQFAVFTLGEENI